MKRVVFIESSCVGGAYCAEAAIELGYSPIFLTEPAVSQGDTRKQILKYDHIECHTGSVERMKAVTSELHLTGSDFITSFSDTSLMHAVALARELGTRGLCPAIERLKDKGVVYGIVPEHSPPSVLFTAQRIPHDRIKSLFRQCGAVIVKARRASGGLGAITLQSPEEVARLDDLLPRCVIPEHLAPDLWMAQGFVEGELVSLEGYVCDCVPRFLGFSGRKKIGMSESRIIFPWDENLSQEARSEAKAAVCQLMARSGFDYGYFHIEFLVKGDRALLIDANVGRIGGGGLGEQIAISYGITPKALHSHILALSIERRDPGFELFESPRRPTISAMYGIPVEAELKSVRLPESLRCLHTQILDDGQMVPQMGRDNYAWIGIISGESDEILIEAPRIKILTSEGEFAAVF
ncbi:MAG TPA: hypothetical protein VNO14_17650 [Blastocatellia bacterium]|nr:hypothetical protein [Blastocatellia bacterium]